MALAACSHSGEDKMSSLDCLDDSDSAPVALRPRPWNVIRASFCHCMWSGLQCVLMAAGRDVG